MKIQEVLARLDTLEPNAAEWSIRLDQVEPLIQTSKRSGALMDPRFDAAGAVWFRRELERIRVTVVAQRFPEMKMADGQIVPIRSTIPTGYVSATYKVERLLGVAKWVAIGAWEDIPRSDIYFEQRTYTRERMALAYGWDTDEIQGAGINGTPLQSGRARANRRGMDTKLNQVGLHGDESHGYYGFFNHPNVPVIFSEVGAGGAYRWSTTTGAKTVEEMKDDIVALRRLMRTNSNNVHKLRRVFLPPSYMEALTLLIPNTGIMGIEFIRRAFADVTFIELDECETGGANGGPCIMGVADLNEEELWLEATEYEEIGPWQENPFRYQMTGIRHVGGVICTHPRGMVKMEFPAD